MNWLRLLTRDLRDASFRYVDVEVVVVDVDEGLPYERLQFCPQSTTAVDGKLFLEQAPEATQRAISQQCTR